MLEFPDIISVFRLGPRCTFRVSSPVLSARCAARASQVVMARAVAFRAPPEKFPFVALLWRFVAGNFSAGGTSMDVQRPSGRPAARKNAGQKSVNRKGDSFRIGRVLAHQRGKTWYLRYFENGQRQRPRVGPDQDEARRMAAEINSQLESGAPSLLGFEPVSIAELRQRWLDHHEHIRRSSVNTIKRYRSATAHLANFVEGPCRVRLASDFRARQAEEFVKYLRGLKVAPNGHDHAKKRPLRDAGIKYILETCCSLFNYAARQRHLSPYAENPFRMIEVSRIPIEDAKPVIVFNENQERRFLEACDDWQFPIFVTLMLTGLRPGELIRCQRRFRTRPLWRRWLGWFGGSRWRRSGLPTPRCETVTNERSEKTLGQLDSLQLPGRMRWLCCRSISFTELQRSAAGGWLPRATANSQGQRNATLPAGNSQ